MTFNLSCKWRDWNPSEECWKQCLNILGNKEEVDRIMAFKRPSPTVKGAWVTGKDNDSAKASMCGRLLMLWVASKTFSKPPSHFTFKRDANEKPFIVGYDNSTKENTIHFNVSHDGDYTIITSSNDTSIQSIGIDIMKNQPPKGQSIEEFFKTMKSCFTEFEWNNIKSQTTESKRLEHFYRHWCLKESYIKADGIGLQLGLQTMEFTLDDDFKTATLKLHAKPTPNPCQFILANIDDHFVAYCIMTSKTAVTDQQQQQQQHYQLHLNNIQTITPLDLCQRLEEMNNQQQQQQ
ncbi:aminoadipate-semialdehyde dehydrogenase-phosphopantetheinyl transferase [Cavenderia fasciculata]|uniref:holo-[acyl-carrier-protein] synthase n=1 Tax=Cavenderia fasciculata TaxID=261658 RepID=F4PT22_CACFS|nr:aminoadipate-semialdehyde dehydrogenase-phosphopantetheinyl transferase [Cavenderia fasciculata]EGG21598.1 aminoadipate-semialdehyde dehydrogenase-phosphopantetheinyl transferase [Cavenderia fasciculata]|eukprot:XP_004359448.1 aminoadipate-semialdehyde dehydrogenase-phosphopantetheinyl transferase [Cavenderia fasciculata]